MKSVKSYSTLVTGLLLATCFAGTTPNAFASRGGETGGGGDICEDRIKIIRDDIKLWIQQGGPKGLTLPSGISHAQYSNQMFAQLEGANIRCVGPTDPGFPVTVNGTPKVCRFDQVSGGQITCDFLKFNATGESDQYVLIHHEFAGLARVELPNQADSYYEISNQISGYLQDVVVKRLAVKPVVQSELTCIPAAAEAFRNVGSWTIPHAAVAAACSGGTKAEQVSRCIPAAAEALRNEGGWAIIPEALAAACSHGTTAEQVSQCIPAASEALRHVGGWKITVEAVAMACSGGTAAEQVLQCIPAAAEAFRHSRFSSGAITPETVASACARK